MAAVTARASPPPARAGAVRSRRGPPEQPPRTGPRPPPGQAGPCGPGRSWSWPPGRGRGLVRLGRHRAEDRVRAGLPAAWHLARPPPGHHRHPPGRRRGLRRLRAARLAVRRALDRRPHPAVCQVVRDILVRARHGRAGRLPPAGPGRSGTGAVARHHDRVLPASPGPGHGDRAGPHAARRRRAGCPGQRRNGAGHGVVPGPVRRGPERTRPGPARGPPVRSTGRHHETRAAGPPQSCGPQHRSRRVPGHRRTRRTSSPAGSPQRGSQYPGERCATPVSKAPTNRSTPWPASSTPSQQTGGQVRRRRRRPGSLANAARPLQSAPHSRLDKRSDAESRLRSLPSARTH